MSSPVVVETQKEHDTSQLTPNHSKTEHQNSDSANKTSKGQTKNDHNKNIQVPTDIAIDNLKKANNSHK